MASHLDVRIHREFTTETRAEPRDIGTHRIAGERSNSEFVGPLKFYSLSNSESETRIGDE